MLTWQNAGNDVIGCFVKMASKEEDDPERLYFASSLSELKQVGRKRVRLENGRVIVLFYVKEEIYALDHFCYRKHVIDPHPNYSLARL